jgi:RND family efflux transporter MFP subunit
MPILSRRLIPATVAAIVLAGGAALALSFTRAEVGEETSETAAGIQAVASGMTPGMAIPVEGAAALRGTLVLGISAAGQAEASRRTIVTAQVGGRVSAVPVRENAPVRAGAPVTSLDPAEFRLAVDDAEARVREAEARYREMTLFDERIADAPTREERDRVARARSGLEVAEVALRRTTLELERTRLTAPFAGRIASLRVEPGQWVRPGDELMTLVQLDPIRVEVQVLESEVGHLAQGKRARVSFAAFPDEPFRGTVQTINPLVESGTRTAKVTLEVPNPRGRILPGMYARVSLDAREFADRILVPRAAVLERDRRPMLFVYDGDEREGRAKWRYVTPGLANDSLVEIVSSPDTESVAAGEVVLVGGHYTLVHDARVRVVEDVKAAGGRPD